MPTEASSFEITEIVVKQSAYDAFDPHGIVQANIDFVNTMVQEGGCVHAELPVNALRGYFVDYYLAQVLNGGLSQFVGNSGWKPNVVRHCFDGLKAMGLKTHYRLFRELEKLLISDRALAEYIADTRGFGDIDPSIASLDDKFMDQHCKHSIVEGNAAWLKSLPELLVVADYEYDAAIEALQTANPHRASRLAARHRKGVQFNVEDILQAAARLLCWMTWRVPITDITAGAFGRPAPDGRKTTSWRVHSPQGSHNVYLFDDIVYFCDVYVGEGQRYTDEMLREGRRRSIEGEHIWDGPGIEFDKESARIGTDTLRRAMATAKDLQVASAAHLACEALQPREALVDVSPIVDKALNFKTWAIATDKSVRFLTFTADGAVLKDKDGNQLAKVRSHDIVDLVEKDAALDAWG